MLDPSLRAFLQTPYTIRRFFVTYGAAFLLSILLLWLCSALASGAPRDILLSLFGNVAGAVFVVLLTFGFFVLVTPPGLRNAEIIPLRDVEIANQIVDLRRDATDYWFWGRSGSYFRADLLPRLSEIARTQRRHIRLRVVLPDPDRRENSTRYMRMRQGLGEKADEITLKANVLATIAAVVRECRGNPYLNAEIGLCPTIPVLRYDLSSTAGLITRDAKKLPGLITNSGNPFFEMFKDAVENELAQSQKITWSAGPILEDLAAPPDITLEFLANIQGLPDHDAAVAARATQLLKDPHHRYAG